MPFPVHQWKFTYQVAATRLLRYKHSDTLHSVVPWVLFAFNKGASACLRCPRRIKGLCHMLVLLSFLEPDGVIKPSMPLVRLRGHTLSHHSVVTVHMTDAYGNSIVASGPMTPNMMV